MTKDKKSSDWDFKVDEKAVDASLKKSQLEAKKRDKKTVIKEQQLEMDLASLPEKGGSRADYVEQAYIAYSNPAKIMKRIIAQIIDLFIVLAISLTISFLVVDILFPIISELSNSFGLQKHVSEDHLRGFIQSLCFLVSYTLFIIYPLSKFSRTVGKKICSLRLDNTEGKMATFGTIFFREYLGKTISMITIIGVLLPFFNKDKKMLHDFLFGTKVTRK